MRNESEFGNAQAPPSGCGGWALAGARCHSRMVQSWDLEKTQSDTSVTPELPAMVSLERGWTHGRQERRPQKARGLANDVSPRGSQRHRKLSAGGRGPRCVGGRGVRRGARSLTSPVPGGLTAAGCVAMSFPGPPHLPPSVCAPEVSTLLCPRTGTKLQVT